jgi:hypothetical protein
MQRFTAEHAEIAEKTQRVFSAVSAVSAVKTSFFTRAFDMIGNRLTHEI